MLTYSRVMAFFLSLALLFAVPLGLGSCGAGTGPDNPPKTESDQTDTAKETETEAPPEIEYTEVRISDETLRDRIEGSWVGQMVGVTWSAPTEFRYCGQIIPDSQVPVWTPETVNDAFGQDDLYVEVPFLEAMRVHGPDATIDQVAPFFRDSTFGLAHANYQGRLNLRAGIEPSKAGYYGNSYHADDIDWQIEADYLGNMYPGLLSLSAGKAFEIGHLVNYGDGVYGGVFVSVMHSAAMVSEDLDDVIRVGVQSIPEGTKFRKVLDQVQTCYEEDMTWEECWAEIQRDWGSDDKCPEFRGVQNIDAKINAAYILIGLLWGEGDFTESVRIAMRCGQDSDCNPSSVAAILGTLNGMSGIPEEYTGAVDYDRQKFAYTEYTLRDCINVTYSVMVKALEKNGGRLENGTWTLRSETGIPVVPFEQWPDDELNVYLDVQPSPSSGTVRIHVSCVPPKGVPYDSVQYVFDMGDGTVIPSILSSYQYLQGGLYTMTCKATAGSETVQISKEIDLSGFQGQKGFKTTASCSVPNPAGGGSREISILTDGYVPSPGAGNDVQYDTFTGNGSHAQEWFALTFDHTVTVSKVLFTEGAHFNNGGWFRQTPAVEALVGGKWVPAKVTSDPLYIEVDDQSAQGDPFQTFTFTLAEPTACTGIRVIGAPGGSAKFVSCSELDVEFTHVENPTYDETDDRNPIKSAIILVSQTNPVGAGCKDIGIIRDGVLGKPGDSHGTVQYDTYVGSPDDHEEFYGYIFRHKAEISEVVFTEGAHFDNGGWFKNGSIRLELLIDGVWTEADCTVSPDYPDGDSQGVFGSPYTTYTFELDDVTECSGIRIIGEAGGTAHFTSVSELSVG